ncbi:MAG: hypothetical protein Q7R87_02915 [Nanoarchaeota archaeon]|nr:hypothetical protein [Nanoarchaeota archaeon]
MIIGLIVLALAIPVGMLVAYMARDELIDGRKWFNVLFIVGVLAGVWFFLTGKNAEGYSSLFVAIIVIVSYIKSFDKKWTRK